MHITFENRLSPCINTTFSSIPTQTSKSKINRVSKENCMPTLIFPGRALLIIKRFLVIIHPLIFGKFRRFLRHPVNWCLSSSFSQKQEKKLKIMKPLYLNPPNGSQDIPSQSHELEQDGRHHFVGFQPLFLVNMTSQTQSGKIMKKNESVISQQSFIRFV